MNYYIDLFLESQRAYGAFLWHEILHPSWHNYFYWVLASSIAIFVCEVYFPWRKDQPAIRNDFWLDTFYIFWNYFLFSLILYTGISNVFVDIFNSFLTKIGITNTVAFELGRLPRWGQLIFIFVLRDFMQYNIHRLLHHVSWMWHFHRVHHSVEEMGYGALMRYHFMEHFFYRALEYIPLAMLGFGLTDFFIIHMFTFTLGQLGHSNLHLPLGKLKYLINGPQMHLWHHAKEFPDSHPKGFNFGISLSAWDYIFKTAHFPHEDAQLPVGLPEAYKVPKGFWGQQLGVFLDFFRGNNGK